jgi:hypothetical protein
LRSARSLRLSQPCLILKIPVDKAV